LNKHDKAMSKKGALKGGREQSHFPNEERSDLAR
jgi:hypothetical protein